MKTSILKKAIQITLFFVVILATLIITKNNIKNVKQLYSSEKQTKTAMTCFADLIY